MNNIWVIKKKNKDNKWVTQKSNNINNEKIIQNNTMKIKIFVT